MVLREVRHLLSQVEFEEKLETISPWSSHSHHGVIPSSPIWTAIGTEGLNKRKRTKGLGDNALSHREF
jgi:hypothetical protein